MTFGLLKTLHQGTTGNWVERISGYAIHEGDEVKITGRYADPGGDPTPEELLAYTIDEQAILADALQDTDVGSYELLYRAEALAQAVIDHPSSSPDDNKGLLEFYQARVQLAEVKNRLATAKL